MTCHDVTLRAMEPDDLDFLYGVENDNSLWHVGNTTVPYSRYLLHDYIANSTADIYRDGQVRLIMENGAKETVGIADVFNFDASNRRAEVSIVVHGLHRRKGYATQALLKLVDYSLRILHLHQLYALVAVDNESSLRLFCKCGFQQSGILKEWLFDGEKYVDVVIMQKKIEKIY